MVRKLIKHISFILLLIFISTSAIQFIHSFEEHNHAKVCSLKGEKELYNYDGDDCICQHFHLNLFFASAYHNYSTSVYHVYKSGYFLKSQIYKIIINLTKLSRAPPTLSSLL